MNILIRRYCDAEDVETAALNCLIDNNIQRLPIPISKICRMYGGKVINNSDEHNPLKLKKGESGRVYVIHGSPLVIVNDKEPVPRIRYTIAHELGHFLLGHLGNDIDNLNREYKNIKPIKESEADSFAARLLAPAYILMGLNIHTPQEISVFCNISMASAKIVARDLNKRYKNDDFLINDYEVKLYENFKPWIDKAMDILGRRDYQYAEKR